MLLSWRVPFYVVNPLEMLPMDISKELNTNLGAKQTENKQRGVHMERDCEQTGENHMRKLTHSPSDIDLFQ